MSPMRSLDTLTRPPRSSPSPSASLLPCFSTPSYELDLSFFRRALASQSNIATRSDPHPSHLPLTSLPVTQASKSHPSSSPSRPSMWLGKSGRPELTSLRLPSSQLHLGHYRQRSQLDLWIRRPRYVLPALTFFFFCTSSSSSLQRRSRFCPKADLMPPSPRLFLSTGAACLAVFSLSYVRLHNPNLSRASLSEPSPLKRSWLTRRVYLSSPLSLLQRPFLGYYAPRFLMWELSTPLLNLHWSVSVSFSSILLWNELSVTTRPFLAYLLFCHLLPLTGSSFVPLRSPLLFRSPCTSLPILPLTHLFHLFPSLSSFVLSPQEKTNRSGSPLMVLNALVLMAVFFSVRIVYGLYMVRFFSVLPPTHPCPGTFSP